MKDELKVDNTKLKETTEKKNSPKLSNKDDLNLLDFVPKPKMVD